MKTIPLNSGKLELPEDWLEVPAGQRMRGFALLQQMLDGQITPFEWQCRMLLLLTGYKPSRRKVSLSERAIINENLVRIAESLDFAFSTESGEDGTTHIRLNYEMHDCPVAPPKNDNPDYWPRFVRDKIIDTNLSARQYSDGVELLKAIDESSTTEDIDYYSTKLASTLIKSQEYEFESSELLAFKLWFTGVVLFWQQHPIYSVLYESGDSVADGVSDERIRLGMQEVILELTERGYHNAGDMLVTDFFDAQVKMLRDNLQEAKANGAKLPDLVKRTGMPLRNINRLI